MALNFLPPMIPPPILYMISPRIVPMGTSIIPALTISPARANTFVPALFSVPNPLYHCEPFRIMGAAFARVSTLLMMVGLSNKPFSKGNGGFCLGSPRFPSMDARREVSSPQTKAPAPMRISRSKEKPLPITFSPRIPAFLAWSMALPSRSTAMGYSALTYTYPLEAPMAYPPNIMPSIMLWGSPSRMLLSINAPGSPSSALQTMNLRPSSDTAFIPASHFTPVGNPAPPRPLRPEAFISSTTRAGVISDSALARAPYPSLDMYASREAYSMCPQFLSATRTWPLKKGISSILGTWTPSSSSKYVYSSHTSSFRRCLATTSSAFSGFIFV